MTPPRPPAREEFFVGERPSRRFDKDGYSAAKRAWFETPGVKRAGEVYSEEAYLRASKRVKRDPATDNAKRKERANYNVSVQEKADQAYSDWA